MKAESLKRIINMVASTATNEPDMEYVRIQNYETGIRVFTHNHSSVCNIFIPEERTGNNCMIHRSKKDFLTALVKEYKKEDVPLNEFLACVVEYKEPLHKIDELMQKTNQSDIQSSFTIDFKKLEALYKSMKQKSNNIRINVPVNSKSLIVANEEGDISLLSKIPSN